MLFSNRASAGQELAERLIRHLPPQPDWARNNMIVAGLPRGGVPVALEVAKRFNCPMEIIVAKKLPFPGQPEYAIGAISADGETVISNDVPSNRQWAEYIDQQKEHLAKRTAQLDKMYHERARVKPHSFAGKTVVVVDDGIATGMTARAALASARKQGAAHLILATPVMSMESYQELRPYCDDLVALRIPQHFGSVGQHYLNFAQTSNEEVIYAMRQTVHKDPHWLHQTDTEEMNHAAPQ